MVAVISGASKGIGKAIAMRFANAGFNLAICSRNSSNLAQCKADILANNPGIDILTYSCDMGKDDEVRAFSQTIIDQFGQVEVLVNNAGIFTADNILDSDNSALEKMMATNLNGNIRLTRLISEIMPRNGKSLVVNIGSTASLAAYPSGSLYTISKHAMLGFSRALREEMKSINIRVTTIMPGAVLTDSWKGTTLPEERFIPADDIAQMVWAIYSLSERTVVEEILIRPMKGDI